ncbi:MAG: TonB-dependent receptor plug domain-containing protein, partial [Gammaproteobacteria bacterium]|nr:TonB-dependent receptor plug domain-containing protein [Gammaproteobacteria bacterium]
MMSAVGSLVRNALGRQGCVVALLLVPFAGALADEPGPAAPDPEETVTVFGSRLQSRTAFDSAVPIDVFSPQEIAAAMSSNELGQVLQALSPSVNMPRASASGTSDSVRAIQLRGLAPDQVLVLVNGKRWHTNAVMDIEGLFPGTVSVDLNAIPLEAIDHIEILRDGAGAMYGSDAIAGVVNIVLKSGTGPASADLGFGENRTYFEPTHSTITDGENRTLGANGGVSLGGEGFVRFGANYQNREPTNRAGATNASFASFNSAPADLALNNQVIFASGDPKLENTGVFYNAELPLAGGSRAYSFATANWRSSRGDAFYRYPDDPSNVLAIYPMGFRPISTGAGNDFGFVLGLRGEAGGWAWDVSAREGYNRFSYGLVNSLNASLGAASPTSFHVATFTSSQQGLNLDLTRKIDAGLAAPLVASIGAEYMSEHYHTGAGDPASYAAGPDTIDQAFGEIIPPGSQGDNGLSPADVVHLARHVSSAYAELEDDLTRRLLLDVAGRYSDYSDYGSSTTGKFSARYKLSDALLVR